LYFNNIEKKGNGLLFFVSHFRIKRQNFLEWWPDYRILSVICWVPFELHMKRVSHDIEIIEIQHACKLSRFFTLSIVIGYLNVSAIFRFWGNHNISGSTKFIESTPFNRS